MVIQETHLKKAGDEGTQHQLFSMIQIGMQLWKKKKQKDE